MQLRGVENIDHLVTSGMFSRIRHPMYAGFILWVLGWGVCRGAVLSLSLGIFAVASILWWRQVEEEALVDHYGRTYAEYRAATWF